jgi:hypothetical protein
LVAVTALVVVLVAFVDAVSPVFCGAVVSDEVDLVSDRDLDALAAVCVDAVCVDADAGDSVEPDDVADEPVGEEPEEGPEEDEPEED